ncbi:MAG: tetratricopeptide repeat protein [Chitinophagales bacterium]
METLRLQKLKEMEVQKPDDAFLKYAIAQEYIALGNRQEALKSYLLLTEHFADYLPTYYQLGKLYEENEETEKALKAYEKGIEIARQQNNQKTLQELKAAIAML